MRLAFNALLIGMAIMAFTTLAEQPRPDPALEALHRQMIFDELRAEPGDAAEEKKHVARTREYEFCTKANRFVQLWTLFAREFNEAGTYNVKAARAAAKAFHDLEKTQGWKF